MPGRGGRGTGMLPRQAQQVSHDVLPAQYSAATVAVQQDVTAATVVCSACRASVPRSSFSGTQLRKNASQRRCVACVACEVQAPTSPAPAAAPAAPAAAPAPATGTSDRSFEIGDYVGIRGLSSRPDLNGRAGVIMSYDAVAERYVVKLQHLDADGREVRVRPRNLHAKTMLSPTDKGRLDEMQHRQMRILKALDANPLRGFRRIFNWATGSGKLAGAERELFRAGLERLRQRIAEGDDFGLCTRHKELPLFSSLPPHQRLQLLADLAVGMLCESTSPPPETPEHHSAFWAVWYTCRSEVEVEIDMERDSEYFATEPRPSPTPEQARANWEELQQHVEESTARGRQIFKQEQRQANLDRQHRRNDPTPWEELREQMANEEREKSNLSHDEILERAHGMAERARRARYCPELGFPGEHGRPARPPQEVPEYCEDPHTFYWRNLAWNLFAERFAEHAERQPNNTTISMGFEVTAREMELWEHSFEAIERHFLVLDEVEEGMIHGRLEGSSAARKQIVHQHRYTITTAFKKNWSPAQTSRAERTLVALGAADTWLNPLTTPSAAPDCKRYLDLALKGDELLAQMPPRRPPSEVAMTIGSDGLPQNEDMTWSAIKAVANGKRKGWLKFWHDALASRSLYDNFDARLSAVIAAAASEQQVGLQPECFEEFADFEYIQSSSIQGMEHRSNCFISPRDWNKNFKREQTLSLCDVCGAAASEGSALTKCSRCLVAVYCSTECQKQDWPEHKRDCKQYERMRTELRQLAREDWEDSDDSSD